MSDDLSQHLIKGFLCFIFNNHRGSIRHLMRPANKLKQLVFVHAVLTNERMALLANIAATRANLLRALLVCVAGDLEDYSARDKEIAKYALIADGINPPGLPNFVRNIFELDE